MSKPIISHGYMNVFRAADGSYTFQSEKTRASADAVWPFGNKTPAEYGKGHVSNKRRVACIRVPLICVEGQFDD